MKAHENHEFIENLFFNTMKKHTLERSFDIQFSDAIMGVN